MRPSLFDIYIRGLELEDAVALYELRTLNKDFLQPFEPLHDEFFYSLAGQTDIIKKSRADWAQGVAYGFGIFDSHTDKLLGRVNLSNISRGAWQSATIGYFLDEKHNGKGIVTQAVRLALEFAFEEIDLHRVQAAVMPHNHASIRVLEKVGFRYEGFAEYYLKINGVWEHHKIYSITREHYDRV